jgi:hypothetical protein
VVIEADRIVYTEHWLRRDGFAPPPGLAALTGALGPVRRR